MKKKTYKIIICISLIVMIFTNFSGIFGATNPEYTPTVQVTENALDSKIKDSILLDALANMINAIASLAEYLIGSIFKTLTGDNVFPWADRIIFNGIGFLDINFLNPASNSLFVYNGTDSILGQVVKSVYSTIFSLAVLFLGVAVGIMAIRLAISSIAAEKAKYKQAIVNWATCIVMLFLMHYILAFVFWINEQMVTIASGILIQTIDDRKLNTVDFTEALNSVVAPEQRIMSFCATAISVPTSGMDWLKYNDQINDISKYAKYILQNKDVANRLLENTQHYVGERLVYVDDNSDDFWANLGKTIGGNATGVREIGLPRLGYDTADAAAIKKFLEPPSTDDKNAIKQHDDLIKKQKAKGYYDGENGKIWFDKEAYLADQDFLNDAAGYAFCVANKGNADELYKFYQETSGYKINTGDNPNQWQVSINSVWSGLTSINLYSNLYNLYINIKDNDIYKKAINNPELRNYIAEKRLAVDNDIISAATGVKSNTTDIIANLGQFFKQSAYVYTSETVENEDGTTKEAITGWRASKVSVTGALLYAIFIFQSCMYLIMYVKRLFFVMMLSMFGPIVVVYDFFMKSAS